MILVAIISLFAEWSRLKYIAQPNLLSVNFEMWYCILETCVHKKVFMLGNHCFASESGSLFYINYIHAVYIHKINNLFHQIFNLRIDAKIFQLLPSLLICSNIMTVRLLGFFPSHVLRTDYYIFFVSKVLFFKLDFYL